MNQECNRGEAMEKLLRTPLLPDKKVKTVIVSGENEEIIEALNRLNIKTIIIKPNTKLEKPIQSHADCMVLQLDDKNILTDESQFEVLKEHFNNGITYIDENTLFVNYLTNRAGETDLNSEPNRECKGFYIHKLPSCVSSPYPSDIKLNVKIIGNHILCNQRHTSDSVLDFAKRNHYKIIHCNQGYAACSSILLDNNSILTDDKSIYNCCASNGINSNEVSIGSIKLKGYDYGFIGGCCGMIDKNILAFTGNPEKHSDYKKIKKILAEHNIEYISLTDNELIDIGGIIPLTTE